MRLRHLALLLCLASCTMFFSGCARVTTAEKAANAYASDELAAAPVNGNLPDYSLTPAELDKGLHLQTNALVLRFGGPVWSILQTILLLWLGVVAWMRDVAVRAGAGLEAKGHYKSSRWVQCFVFLGLFTLIGFVLDLPLHLFSHYIGFSYGLSVQGWGSWFIDQAKTTLLGWIFGGLVLMLLYWVIRTFPRRWWVVFWVCSIPITIFIIFAGPYIGFLFNHYEPLAKNNPELVAQLQKVVAKGHMGIPPERMYLMKASEKVTTLNADVEGFGSSKRVVVWDNTIAKMTPDEVVGVFGHESGHYVLGHITRGIIMSFAIVFCMLFFAFHFMQWAIARYGARWRIPSQADWGSFAVLMLFLSLFSVVLEPLSANLVRVQEHAADVYGQEAIHGIVANPQATMQGAFQVLGENSFDVPNPPLWEEFWFDSHPSIGRRAAFAHVYDPWQPGYMPKYLKKD